MRATCIESYIYRLYIEFFRKRYNFVQGKENNSLLTSVLQNKYALTHRVFSFSFFLSVFFFFFPSLPSTFPLHQPDTTSQAGCLVYEITQEE